MTARNPVLKEAIEIAKIVEESSSYMREMDNLAHRKKMEIGAEVDKCTSSDINVVGRKNMTKQTKPVYIPTNQKRCTRCGSEFYSSNSKMCFATNRECRLCGKKGHYARVCRQRFGGNNEAMVGEEEGEQKGY